MSTLDGVPFDDLRYLINTSKYSSQNEHELFLMTDAKVKLTGKGLSHNNDLEYTLLCSTIAAIQALLCITKTRLYKYIENFTTKKRKFSDKNPDIFHISAENIGCGYRGGSNEYTQSMFWTGIRKLMYTPVNPSFTV